MTATVLLIDDEPDAGELFRQNFRRQIRNGEFELVFVQSGEEALDYLGEDETPNAALVLSDIRMPGISGIDILENIKPRWPKMPIFMVSATAGQDIENTVRDLGADGFYTKPIDFKTLGQKMSSLLSGAAA